MLPHLLKTLRPHQWIKNLLLVAPILLSHTLPWHSARATQQWIQVGAAFLAFCLAASAVYVANDVLDLAADRAHPVKRRRPFAAGLLPVRIAPVLILLLLLAALALSLLTPWRFLASLGVYVATSAAYVLGLKRRLLIDVFLLAGLYTLRLMAGGYAADVAVSRWLFAFSVFLFVSLAFAKRYVELVGLDDRGETQIEGRNYTVGDLRIIESVGPASGYMAVLVLALYINDTAGIVNQLYRAPSFLWLVCPLMMYWVTRIWFMARRGKLDDDPILFAVKDRVSWMTLLAGITFVVLAWQPWR